MPQPFHQHIGRAVALRRDNVDTDQIVPAEFCKRVTKSGYEDALFANWRKEADFALSQPRAAGASLLLAGRNFGIGSSREHAVWALRDGGFTVVIAAGFGDIFQRNALNNGLLPIEQPLPVVEHLMSSVEANPEGTVAVDLVNCTVSHDEEVWDFTVEARARRLLLAGHDAISSSLRHADLIFAHEQSRAPWLPELRNPEGPELGNPDGAAS
ncbi:3-isopropylmalate dehydratase small subunit [Streptomyces sp. NPDC059452]|uniref:3-isopropylmalate dehydratase small subunit n=1 Tax=Streptomyces sp. NPDC059452 TaxID=3346835 RepID=UPI0036782A94